MSEFIGSRISLISKSDIRYVGTLVEINSEASTVSLDNVRSFGTEGRKGGKDEYPPSDVVYEQIVFRGSNVKDLRIEEPAKEKAPPAMPQDPAIIGVQQSQPRQDNVTKDQPHPQPPHNFPQHNQFPSNGYPPFGPGGPGGPYQNRFNPQGGFPGGQPPFPGGPPGHFGVPPFPGPHGWFPAGQGYNGPPGPFPSNVPIGPSGSQPQNQKQPPQGPRDTASSAPQIGKSEKPALPQPKVAEADGAAQEVKADPKVTGTTSAPSEVRVEPPLPPVESKPDVAAALAPPQPQPGQQAVSASKSTPSGPRGGRIVPAVPIPSPNVKKSAPYPQQHTVAPVTQTLANVAQQQSATQLATAAVAEAMAKLNLQNKNQGQAPAQAPASDPFNNLAQKVEGMREQQNRQNRGRGAGDYRARGGRGGRGGHAPHQKMEVPTTDYDFASANAKFNKQELVKEAIASGSPLGDPSVAFASEGGVKGQTNGTSSEEVVIPAAAAYDKNSSFFDNISSELKCRDEAVNRRGQEFRSEERRKNMETFGQGSVDGYRGGFRSRGRGRGRGRGFGHRGRGAPRGHGGAQLGETSAV